MQFAWSVATGGSSSVFCRNVNYIQSSSINRIYKTACQHELSQEAGCNTDFISFRDSIIASEKHTWAGQEIVLPGDVCKTLSLVFWGDMVFISHAMTVVTSYGTPYFHRNIMPSMLEVCYWTKLLSFEYKILTSGKFARIKLFIKETRATLTGMLFRIFRTNSGPRILWQPAGSISSHWGESRKLEQRWHPFCCVYIDKLLSIWVHTRIIWIWWWHDALACHAWDC